MPLTFRAVQAFLVASLLRGCKDGACRLNNTRYSGSGWYLRLEAQTPSLDFIETCAVFGQFNYYNLIRLVGIHQGMSEDGNVFHFSDQN